MLVLTRKLGEAVCIGDDVQVRVIRLGGGRVRLGITAPVEVRVVREEVMKATDAERKETQDGS